MSNYPYDPNGSTPYDQNAQTEPSAGRSFPQGAGAPYGQGNSLTPPPPPAYSPPPPPAYSMQRGYTNYPPQSFPQPTPPPPTRPKGATGKIVIIVSIVAVLIIASLVGVLVIVRGGGTTVTPTPTPTTISYPALASAYAGTVHNSTASLNSDISFTSLVQTKGNITGSVTVGLPLIGSGPFSGTISASGSVHLVDTSNDGSNVKITFTGSMDASKNISGSYSVNNDQGGSWKAQPATAPVVYPVLYMKYSGTYTNDSTGKIGNLSLAFTSQNQQTFNGTFTVDAGGTGLAGTVGSNNTIQFNVGLTEATLDFKGTDNQDGSLSGTYIYTATSAAGGKDGNGTWKETPA